MTDRPTFTVIWNPDRWPPPKDWQRFEREWNRTVEATHGNPPQDVVWSWSFGRATEESDIQVGDRVFFLRVGDSAERGFLASGYVESEDEGSPVWFDAHWDGEGKPQAYIDLRLDTAVPLDDPLPKAALDAAISDISKPLKIQSSGTRLNPGVAEELERLWADHSRAGQLPEIDLRPYDALTIEVLRPKRQKGRKKTERRLQEAYALKLGGHGHTITRPRYKINGIPGKKLGDLFDCTTNTLIEVKVHPRPSVVSAAIDQIFDYASLHADRPNLELLFHSRPGRAELAAILSKGICCTWKSGNGFQTRPPA